MVGRRQGDLVGGSQGSACLLGGLAEEGLGVIEAIEVLEDVAQLGLRVEAVRRGQPRPARRGSSYAAR